MMSALFLQVLVITEKLGDFTAQLYEVHHFIAIPAILVHSNIRPAGYATVWWSVQLRRGYSADQFQHVPYCVANSLPSEYPHEWNGSHFIIPLNLTQFNLTLS